MSSTLVNVTATAGQQVLEAPGTVRATLTVANAAVLASFRQGWPSGTWGPDEFLLPGVHALERRCDAIGFRRAATPALGKPAPQVSITALTPGD
jgi:hypothetical protein